MTLKLYNTFTRKKQEFKPIKKGVVHMYTCGPTVYDYAHIGNFRAYVNYDILRRYLKFKGFKVKQVMNITDIDDKTIKKSQEEGKSIKKFTEFYEKEFLKDLKALNIEMPEIMPHASDHIKEMVELIQKLSRKGYTYEANGSIYFKISKFKDYGKLAKLDMESLKENADGRLADADEYEKEDARDFVLWKGYNKSDGGVFWNPIIGKGRPGWHIECSVMSMKYLGKTFDIHTGGIDLIFPHHTNEIAQSESATDEKFVNYWIHNEHLLVNNKKMSKSLENYFTLRDLLKKGYKPIAIRYLLLSAHYRQKLNFTLKGIEAAEKTVQKFYDFIDKLKEYKDGTDNSKINNILEKTKSSFEQAMDDDLNTSKALGIIFDMMSEINKLLMKKDMNKKNAEKVLKVMKEFDLVLGVMEHKEEKTPKKVIDLIEKREEAREKKDFKIADKIREEIGKLGYIIEDTKEGVKCKKK